MVPLRWALLLLAFALSATGASASAGSVSCVEWGFNPSTLSCTTCDVVLRVIGDDKLHGECLQCCTKTAEEPKYERAVLEIDKRFTSSFSDIKKIISSINSKNKKTKLKDGEIEIPMEVSVSYVFGARPVLHVYKSATDRSPADSISVMNWSKDVFADFFTSSYAVPATATAKKATKKEKDEL